MGRKMVGIDEFEFSLVDRKIEKYENGGSKCKYKVVISGMEGGGRNELGVNLEGNWEI